MIVGDCKETNLRQSRIDAGQREAAAAEFVKQRETVQHRRRQCDECGMATTGPAMVQHQRSTGHQGWTTIFKEIERKPRKQRNLRYQCDDCGMVSAPGALGAHQSRQKHYGRTLVTGEATSSPAVADGGPNWKQYGRDSSRNPVVASIRSQEYHDLIRAGFRRAPFLAVCGLCPAPIEPGDWVRKLPDSWRPEKRHRHGHYECLCTLVEDLSAKTGMRVVL